MDINRSRPHRHPLTTVVGAFAVAALLGATGCSGSDGDASPATTATPAPASDPTPTTSAVPATDGSAPADTTATTDTVLPADAVVVFQRDGVRVSDAAGRSEVLLTPDLPQAEHPDWSPDGTSIVFDTDFSTIWQVPSHGGTPEQLVTCAAPCFNLYEGAWSPDGTEIAYAMVETEDGTNTSRASIEVMDVTTGDTRTVYENTTGQVWMYTPRWSSDGGSIVVNESTFASTRLDESETVNERIAVIALGASPAPATYLTPDRSSTDGTGYEPADLSNDWNRAEDLVVYSESGNLFTVRPDGTELRQLTHYDGLTEHAIQPTFLPDGNGIVFTYVTGTFGVDDEPRAAVISLDGAAMVVLGHSQRVTHPRVRPSSK